MMENKKTVGIIGGGPCGLIACKLLIETGVLEPTIFEKECNFGGIWAPNTNSKKVWNSLTTNLSKYSFELSDFPFNESVDLFPTQHQVYQYLNDYSNHFNIKKHIKTNCNVKRVYKSNDKWGIEWIDSSNGSGNNNTTSSMEFDFIIIACGAYNKPAPIDNIVELNGINYKDNSNKIIHSKDYKSPEFYKNQKVLVVGNGSSGTQISCEISKEPTCTVHNLVKSVKWFLPYIATSDGNVDDGHGKPIDALVFVRSLSYKLKGIDDIDKRNRYLNSYYRQLSKNNQDCKQYEILSETCTDNVFTHKDYLKQINQGYIKIVKSDTIDDINSYDKVIVCNGYRFELSFLDQDIQDSISYKEHERHRFKNLYKDMFCPLYSQDDNLNNPSTSLAFIGMHTPQMELSARYVTLVFSNQLKLPTISKMNESINSKNNFTSKNDYNDLVLMCDDFASDINCLPNFNEIKNTDPQLHNALWNSLFHPSGYKLFGPDSKFEQSKKQLYKVYNNLL